LYLSSTITWETYKNNTTSEDRNFEQKTGHISIPLYSTRVFEFGFATQFPPMHPKLIQAVDLSVGVSICRVSDQILFDPTVASAWIRPQLCSRGCDFRVKLLESSGKSIAPAEKLNLSFGGH
jgi:hypothetical protein